MVLKQSMFLKPRERVLTCRMMPLSPSRINVGAPMAEVGEDVLPVPAELSGEGLHRFRPRMHHPRAQCLGPGLRLRAVGSVGVDVLQAFAHPARPGGLRPPLRRIAPDLRLRVREVGLVPGPQALRPFQQAVLPGLGLANRSTACASLPGVTLVTLRSVRSATTVMHWWSPRLVSSMPIASTPVQSSYRRASCT